MPATADILQVALQVQRSLWTLFLAVVISTVAVVLYTTCSFIFRNRTSPLRILPGPPPCGAHLFWGHGRAIWQADNSVIQEGWVKEYGPTIAYKGMLSIPHLWTMDKRALNHILTHANIYEKPSRTQFHLTRIVGRGLLVTEGEQHKHQRRVMNPAFGPAQVRELTGIFIEKSQVLRDVWMAEITKSDTGLAHVDAMSWVSKTTLDIIGIAGFDYSFNALDPKGQDNELIRAFSTLYTVNCRPGLLSLLQSFVPVLRIIKTNSARQSADAQKVMERIGLQLIAEKKASISGAGTRHNIHTKDVHGRDLLTLLIKANMAKDIPESQRLTDQEVLAQVPTFLVAGHETTSTAIMWALFSLTQHPEIQRKLRDELFSVRTENPSMEELQALQYLEMFVREVLRYHSPVPLTDRAATKDDAIPLDTPFVGRDGVERKYVRVQKGDIIMVPILALNRHKVYWGEDAMEFKPERWEHPPEAISSIPSVYANNLSFISGPRACIGYRFALIEMKAILFTLVRSFEFELDAPVAKIKKRTVLVQRVVVVRDDGEEEARMPLVIRPYVHV